jgi:hypothetical protein
MIQAFKWGLITTFCVTIWLFGAFSLLSLLLLHIPKETLRTLTGALGLVVLFIGILLGMKSVKMNPGNGKFDYLKALGAGMIITLIVALTVSLASFLYAKWINPNLAEDMVKEAANSLKAAGTGVEETAKKLESVRKEFSPQSQFVAPLIVQTIAGCLFSFTLAFFLRNKK